MLEINHMFDELSEDEKIRLVFYFAQVYAEKTIEISTDEISTDKNDKGLQKYLAFLKDMIEWITKFSEKNIHVVNVTSGVEPSDSTKH